MSSLHQFHGYGRVYIGSGSITISNLSAAAEEDLTITDANVDVGDVVAVSLANADMETGVAIIGAWISADNTISIRISNVHSGSITGGAATVYYTVFRAS